MLLSDSRDATSQSISCSDRLFSVTNESRTPTIAGVSYHSKHTRNVRSEVTLPCHHICPFQREHM